MSRWLRMSPLSGANIQIAFLGETKRSIPRSRPASGRASRAGLVQDAAYGTGAQRRHVLDEPEHGAMLVQVGPLTEARLPARGSSEIWLPDALRAAGPPLLFGLRLWASV